ncbi:hypothetical protein SAMN04488009_3092 [Maribacter sedimenticola]|uniref:Fibronectin type-III domain-containing protein n=1 Tax=Maribacter sedimenticola TaxID=228956 RepID=A0ABY1SK23_9FLAO|nr:hypothetical protein [Maribacter sedimenticola]SNR67127.1 hypothetical protein SAMN04488009_3092 [Maribacter sedimenticola]
MRKSLFFLLIATCFSCGVDLDVLDILGTDQTIALTFPENDSECTEGTIVSDTQSELVFKWLDENNSSPYTVHLTNVLAASTETYDSNEQELAIILDRGVVYSWFVTGKLNTSSETWNFYNAGPGVASTIPLPAIAISPVSGATISQTSTAVNLIWQSEDEDNDIIGHDLYFGETDDPEIFAADILETRFDAIEVTSGKVYYWKVVTKDSNGNESTSPIFTFTVA